MQEEVQSPFNGETAISAYEKKEDGDEVMGVVCVAIIAMYSIQHADRVFVPSWNICSARPPSLLSLARASLSLRIYIIKRAGLAHG